MYPATITKIRTSQDPDLLLVLMNPRLARLLDLTLYCQAMRMPSNTKLWNQTDTYRHEIDNSIAPFIPI